MEKSVIPVPPDLVYKMVLVPELKVLLSRDQIAKRVTEMAEEITRDFKGNPSSLSASEGRRLARAIWPDKFRSMPLSTLSGFRVTGTGPSLRTILPGTRPGTRSVKCA